MSVQRSNVQSLTVCRGLPTRHTFPAIRIIAEKGRAQICAHPPHVTSLPFDALIHESCEMPKIFMSRPGKSSQLCQPPCRRKQQRLRFACIVKDVHIFASFLSSSSFFFAELFFFLHTCHDAHVQPISRSSRRRRKRVPSDHAWGRQWWCAADAGAANMRGVRDMPRHLPYPAFTRHKTTRPFQRTPHVVSCLLPLFSHRRNSRFRTIPNIHGVDTPYSRRRKSEAPIPPRTIAP